MITVNVQKRGCGWPKEGGFYVMGGGKPLVCFALPVTLVPCECCNQMPKFARCPTPVTAEYIKNLFYGKDGEFCGPTCHACVSGKRYWISWVGSDYTTETFCREVNVQGMSRRIPPSFAKLIQPGDVFANVKGGEIINMIPCTSVRYYLKPGDSEEKIKELEKEGIEVAKIGTKTGDGVQTELKEKEKKVKKKKD